MGWETPTMINLIAIVFLTDCLIKSATRYCKNFHIGLAQITALEKKQELNTYLALPTILWDGRHDWVEAVRVVAFVTRVTHQHPVVISRLAVTT